MEPYQQLEEAIGKWAQVENVVCCNSGTAALHLALESLQLPKNSEVILPDYTMIACARAVTLAGLTPVFVDCKEDLLIDCDLVEEYLDYVKHLESHKYMPNDKEEATNRVKVIMPVHIYGRLCNMERICQLANRHNLYIIEDCAESHGADWRYGEAIIDGPMQRSQRDYPPTIKCWSFYKNKIVCGEEGGAISFPQRRHAEIARQLRSQGFTDAHDFTHIPRGHNYRMPNCCALPILDSLSKIENSIACRRVVESAYDEICPDEWKMPKRDVPWVYDIKLPVWKDDKRERIIRNLNHVGIQARYGFKPMHSQAEYEEAKCLHSCEVWSTATEYGAKIIYLPLVGNVQPRQTFDIIHGILGT